MSEDQKQPTPEATAESADPAAERAARPDRQPRSQSHRLSAAELKRMGLDPAVYGHRKGKKKR